MKNINRASVRSCSYPQSLPSGKVPPKPKLLLRLMDPLVIVAIITGGFALLAATVTGVCTVLASPNAKLILDTVRQWLHLP